MKKNISNNLKIYIGKPQFWMLEKHENYNFKEFFL